MLNAETVVLKPQEAGTREYNAPPLSTMIPLTWVNNVTFLLFFGQTFLIFALLTNLFNEKRLFVLLMFKSICLAELICSKFCKRNAVFKQSFIFKYSPMNPEPRNSAKLLGNFSNPKYSNLL